MIFIDTLNRIWIYYKR